MGQSLGLALVAAAWVTMGMLGHERLIRIWHHQLFLFFMPQACGVDHLSQDLLSHLYLGGQSGSLLVSYNSFAYCNDTPGMAEGAVFLLGL